MIDDTHDNENSINNRILIHESMTAVNFNEHMKWITVQVKPGQEEICLRALQEKFNDYALSFVVDKTMLHIGVRANQASPFSDTYLREELKDLLVSSDRKQPSDIRDIHVANRLKKIVMELSTRAYADIICMESEFIEGFQWLSRAFCDASALLKGEELQYFNLEGLLFVSDAFDNLIKRMSQKSVVLTAVCLNKVDERLEAFYPDHPALIDPKITGDLDKSKALGNGTAYYHPTSGDDDCLEYCSWRFHEPIPVEDVQSITAIFKQLSALGLPSSRYFLELRELGEDSVFTVFSPDYEEWHVDVWD